MKNGFVPLAIIVLIIAVIVLGGGAAIAWRTTYLDPILPSTVREFLKRGAVPSSESPTETPTPAPGGSETPENPTKDWKTYTNSKYSFSFKYPKDWEMKILAGGEVLLFGPYAKESSEAQPRPQFEVFPIGGYGSNYGWDEPGSDFAGKEGQWKVEENAASVGGRSAKRAEHTYKPEGLIKVTRIYFGDPSDGMRLEFYPLGGKLELFDLILNTFRFL